MLLYVTLTFYFKVKLFIIWKENILFLGMLLRLRRSSPPIKLTATIYWNIVESGIKHNKPKPNTKLIYNMLLYVTLTFYFKVKLFIIWKENILFLDMLLHVLGSSPPIKLTATIYTKYYMSKSVSHAVSTRESYNTPRATGPRGDIGQGFIRHVIQILTCKVHYIIYFNHAFDNRCI